MDNTKLENKAVFKADENKAEDKKRKVVKPAAKLSKIAKVEYIKFCYGIKPGTKCSIPRCDVSHMLKQGYIKVLD